MKRKLVQRIAWGVMTLSAAGGLVAAAPMEAAAKAKAGKGYVIGVANGYYGNDWRTQMIADIQTVAKQYEKQGVVSNVVIENANNDVSQQISQIQNMINSGVNAILIDPVSATGLLPVIAKAQAAGILVIPFDGVVNSPKVINVTTDQYSWAYNGAYWLAQQLHGKGNVLIMNGLAGVPANTIRQSAEEAAFKKFPGIKIVHEANGNWDEAYAQQTMTSLISSYPKLDGIYTQDGMGMGIIQAYIAAHKKVPLMTGDVTTAFFKYWVDHRKTFHSYIEANPPGIGATAFEIAVDLLNGKKLKPSALQSNPIEPSQKNTILVKSPLTVTNANLMKVWNTTVKGKPSSYSLDAWLTPSQVLKAFFK